jgi:hypothetical protein
MAGLWAVLAGTTSAGSALAADDTWTALGSLPPGQDGPVFALAVDPASDQVLLAGTGGGAVLRSEDGGATWRAVRSGLGRGVAALAFDPGRPTTVLAGTRGAGIWQSWDAGLTWQQQPGAEGRTVRAFAFPGSGVALAGGDEGVLASRGDGPWSPSGLSQVRVSALAAGASGQVLAGGDSSQGSEPLPLYLSADGGQSWTSAPAASGLSSVQAPGGSSMVSALLATSGPLLMGTNDGLFASSDAAATWQQLTGGGALPIADFSAIATAPRRPQRLYVASDGGASDQGGIWVSTDAGADFATLSPPLPEVTALAVSSDEVPRVVVATFRPDDHGVALWTYRDAGGPPSNTVVGATGAGVPAPSPPPAAGAPAPAWRELLGRPETPYVAIGLAALLAVIAALGAYVRHGRAW